VDIHDVYEEEDPVFDVLKQINTDRPIEKEEKLTKYKFLSELLFESNSNEEEIQDIQFITF